MKKIGKLNCGIRVTAILLAFFLMFNCISFVASAKSGNVTSLKSVTLKIGNTAVTNKTFTMEKGETKKLTVHVMPKSGKKSVQFTSSNKKVAVVSKKGAITAKKTGNVRINVTVKAGKQEKTVWVKIKVAADKNTGANQNPNRKKKSIVIYFSCTESTKRIAEYIKDITASDIYRIEPADPYTSADLDYSDVDSRTSREQNNTAARPAIAGDLPSLAEYDFVYIGYPIWWGQAPKIMYTFLENYNLSGKTIIPFCTSGSSGIGTSAKNLQTADRNQADWLAGKRFSENAEKSQVKSWISDLGL